MFLIEADGKSVLYTGDFRANGRLDYGELVITSYSIHYTKLYDEIVIKQAELMSLNIMSYNFV